MMAYFAPGLRELARIGKRVRLRGSLVLARRKLASAETRLGLLGWQQADFDAETQRQVDAIQHVEREQATLTNRAAELGREIDALTAERARAREEAARNREALEAERAGFAGKRAEVDRIVETLNKRQTELERQNIALNSEEKELDALYRRLLVTQPQTAVIRDEILGIRERLFAIEKERTDAKRGLARSSEDLGRAGEERDKLNESIAGLDQQLRSQKTAAAAQDGEWGSKLRELEQARAQTSKAFDQLERAKLDPYREIGRVLADSHVGPVNQPDALTSVYELRQQIAEGEAAIAASQSESSTEDFTLVRISIGLWGVIAVAVVLVFAALL